RRYRAPRPLSLLRRLILPRPSLLRRVTGAILSGLLLIACKGAEGVEDRTDLEAPASPEAIAQAQLGTLAQELARVDSISGEIDEIFRPLPLLTPAQEQGLRQYP